jgi:predicted enzyme related to lactoylglutathione lyase
MMAAQNRPYLNSRKDSSMSNPFVHLELNTPDLPKAKDFYSAMFGWEFSDMDMGPAGVYSTFKPASGPGGGAFTVPGGHKGWLPYIGVQDIKESTEKARSLGANIIIESHEIPNVGWMTIMVDPTECTIAMFQPKEGGMAS